MSDLQISQDQFDQIVSRALAGLPNEACGLLLGPHGPDQKPTGKTTEVFDCHNAAASAKLYTVEPKDFLKASQRAEELGGEIIGVWHSHTHTDPYPSPTDVEQAVDPNWFYAIISLKYDSPVLRAYRIAEVEITEMTVKVS